MLRRCRTSRLYTSTGKVKCYQNRLRGYSISLTNVQSSVGSFGHLEFRFFRVSLSYKWTDYVRPHLGNYKFIINKSFLFDWFAWNWGLHYLWWECLSEVIIFRKIRRTLRGLLNKHSDETGYPFTWAVWTLQKTTLYCIIRCVSTFKWQKNAS